MDTFPDVADSTLMQSIEENLRTGHLKGAQSGLDRALAAEPGSVPLLMLRAMAQFRQRLWKGAMADFKAARALDPGDPEAWLGEALCLAVTGDVYPAMEAFEALLVGHPEFVRGRIQAARFYFKLVVPAKGRAHLNAALAADPSADERREITAMMAEQEKLDRKRIYRPDFEALRRRKAARAAS